jgi:hypothetical protein
MEIRNIKGQNQLLIHLPDQTLVYDAKASQLVGEPVWFILISGTYGNSQYLVRDHVWCYNEWLVANPAGLECGTLSESTGSQWGNPVRWEFGTQMIYNEGRGAIIHELELIAVTGRIENGKDPTISTSYSLDGISWSQERFIKAGKTGDRLKRLIWLQNGSMKRFRLQRFKGTSDAFISIARLEARLEPLSV